ncbi:hypothetical protein DTO96_102523 [Ephemeroptericola cinctiostellae]|uniref:Tail sheath protein subtilisin-like domain-containing protein n=1 Tax=Ephemeroptericola cinctiostellae TaxID=2268024 RepID=A0A345DEH9_9BURK|nr:phage tail sheath subtilisin-like domain-containing protein [Ephemeroptericola cinctiostellae]AXF86767.1 hypothetical protein DTO96_102523 [Ephemeroptericola cinctiostellae]
MPDNMTYMSIPIGRTGGVFIEIDPTKAVTSLPQMQRKLLVIGQRLAGAQVPALTPDRQQNGESTAQAHGRGSTLHVMMMAIDKVKAPYGDIDTWVVGVDDLAAGVAASGTLTFGGAVTRASTLSVYVGGVLVRCAASVGDTAAVMASKITAAINLNTDLPVAATVSGNVVTVTCTNKGEVGNGMELSYRYYEEDALPLGLTLACVSLAGGSGNPDVAAALACVADEQFYSIVCPFTDSTNLATIEADMDGRWGGMVQKAGHVFTARDGTMAALTTWGATRNSVHCTTWGLRGSPTWLPARLAAFAATCEVSGARHPAMPLRALEVPGVKAPRPKDRFSRAERELLLSDGISSTIADSGNKVILERVITNYQKNTMGFDDESLLRLETKWTVDYYRFAHRQNIALKFPRCILVDDDTNISPDLPHVKASMLQAECYALDKRLEYVGIIENPAKNKEKYRFLRSEADKDRVNAILPPNVTNQFVTFAAAVQYQL